MTQPELQPNPQREIRAPYNFVPFPDQVIIPYPQNVGRPLYSDSLTDYLSGQIRITVTAQTPIVIATRYPSADAAAIPFPAGPDGTPFIPGSTIRGLLRSNMSVLGFGSVQNGGGFRNLHPNFREIWDPEQDPETFARALYRKKLGIMSVQVPQTEKRYSIPTKVLGGYLYCDRYAKGFIRPTKGAVYHISREADAVKPWANRYAMYERVWYQAEGSRVTRVQEQPFPGGSSGFLLSPAWKKNQHSMYLFPEPDMQAAVIPLTKERILEYQLDYDRRKNRLRGTNPEHPADPNFWAIPQDIRKPKPVFYHLDGDWVNFGMSRFLSLKCIKSLTACVPEVHRWHTTSDYPTSIFGTTYLRRALGSRVSIGDCKITAKTPATVSVVPYLRNPNPAFGPNYLKDGKTYNHDDAMLRGYKHYWLKDPVSDTPKKGLAYEAMPAGSRFSGVIRYHHLRPDELGLLLWCIRLEEGCFHTIGHGKPYGYGRVRIEIDALYEYDPSQLYRSLTAAPEPCEHVAQRVEQRIRQYEQTARTLLACPKKSLLEYPHIQDFLYMKKTIRTDMERTDYMYVGKGYNEYEQCNAPLPTVQEIREQEAAMQCV